jgi:TolA-binding protein
MAQLSISAAARAWGISRQTIYNKINENVLSVTKDDNGNSHIDSAEMLRCFGEPSSTGDTTKTIEAASGNSLRHQLEIEMLKRQTAEEKAQSLADQVSTLREQVARLEAKDSTKDEQLSKALETIYKTVPVAREPEPAARRGLLDWFLTSKV